MDSTDDIVTSENELAAKDALTPVVKMAEGAEDVLTAAVKPFWRSFTEQDARSYWISFGATVAGTLVSLIIVTLVGIVLKWLKSSSPAPPDGACYPDCPSGASPAIAAWVWFAAGVLVLSVSLIVVARRRTKRGKTAAAPAVLAIAVALFGILVLLVYWFLG